MSGDIERPKSEMPRIKTPIGQPGDGSEKNASPRRDQAAYRRHIKDLVARGLADNRALDMLGKVTKHMSGNRAGWKEASEEGYDGG